MAMMTDGVNNIIDQTSNLISDIIAKSINNQTYYLVAKYVVFFMNPILDTIIEELDANVKS